MGKELRQLPVDLLELDAAFEDASYENRRALDVGTGQIIFLMEEIQRKAEDLRIEAGEAADLAAFVKALDIPDWEKDALVEADRVEEGFGTRYVEVPVADSSEGYADMERFIETVSSERFRERLDRAIRGSGAFRRFKDVLEDHTAERQRWFEFKDERLRGRVLRWLEHLGIEPVSASEVRP